MKWKECGRKKARRKYEQGYRVRSTRWAPGLWTSATDHYWGKRFAGRCEYELYDDCWRGYRWEWCKG